MLGNEWAAARRFTPLQAVTAANSVSAARIFSRHRGRCYGNADAASHAFDRSMPPFHAPPGIPVIASMSASLSRRRRYFTFHFLRQFLRQLIDDATPFSSILRRC
jgi:hypothetical protein